MTNTIPAARVLELLSKATVLGISYTVREYDSKYYILFDVDWYYKETKRWSTETVIITKGNQSKWSTCWDFDSFMAQLDAKVKELEQERIKTEKREKLVKRLTQEERELLGV